MLVAMTGSRGLVAAAVAQRTRGREAAMPKGLGGLGYWPVLADGSVQVRRTGFMWTAPKRGGKTGAVTCGPEHQCAAVAQRASTVLHQMQASLQTNGVVFKLASAHNVRRHRGRRVSLSIGCTVTPAPKSAMKPSLTNTPYERIFSWKGRPSHAYTPSARIPQGRAMDADSGRPGPARKI